MARTELVTKRRAYEPLECMCHIFEVYRNSYLDGSNGAQYTIMLDGAFLSTAETWREYESEIVETIRWYDWQTPCPFYQ